MVVLIDGVRYRLITPESEASLEESVRSNHRHIFGADSFYFDMKRLIRSRAGVATIPDGYVICFTPKPKWAIIEIELASHPIYEHLIPQLSKFNRGIEDSSTKRLLVDSLYAAFNADEVLKAQLKQRIQTGEVYKFISDLISEEPLIVVIIDRKTDELEEALRDIRGGVRVIEVRTFQREDVSSPVNAFVFEPLFWTSKLGSSEKAGKCEGGRDDVSGRMDAIRDRDTEPVFDDSHDPSEPRYRVAYRKQLDDPHSMASKILKYVQEKGGDQIQDSEKRHS